MLHCARLPRPHSHEVVGIPMDKSDRLPEGHNLVTQLSKETYETVQGGVNASFCIRPGDRQVVISSGVHASRLLSSPLSLNSLRLWVEGLGPNPLNPKP